MKHCRTALSINTYQGEANYLYWAYVTRQLGNNTDAKDGFSVASYSPSVRSAAYEKLAEMFLLDKNWAKAEHYALQSKEFNQMNLSADHVLMVVYRKTTNWRKQKRLSNRCWRGFRCTMLHVLNNSIRATAPDIR